MLIYEVRAEVCECSCDTDIHDGPECPNCGVTCDYTDDDDEPEALRIPRSTARRTATHPTPTP